MCSFFKSLGCHAIFFRLPRDPCGFDVGKPSTCMIYCNIQKCKFTKSGSTTLSCLCFFSKPWKPPPLAQLFVDGWPLTPRGWQTPVCGAREVGGGLWNGFFLQCQATSLKDAKLMKATAQQILENTRKIKLPNKTKTANKTTKKTIIQLRRRMFFFFLLLGFLKCFFDLFFF